MKKTDTNKLLEEMREATERAADALSPIIKAADAAQKQYAEIYKQREEFNKALEPLIKAQEQAAKLAESIRPTAAILEDAKKQAELVAKLYPSRIHSALSAQHGHLFDLVGRPALQQGSEFMRQAIRVAESARAYQLSLHRAVLPAYNFVNDSFHRLPAQMRGALMNLAKYGWFLDFNMPLPRVLKLDVALERGEISEAESVLVEHFRGRISNIQGELATAYPHRTKILSSAFAAHVRGEYALAIPVFLAQANGICKEITRAELFTKRDGKPAAAEYIESVEAEAFLDAVLFPLTQGLPIAASQSERDAGFVGLNRHTVMHGESLDYDSEINSLRAISFLSYIGYVLKRAADRKQRMMVLQAKIETEHVKPGDLVEDVVKGSFTHKSKG